MASPHADHSALSPQKHSGWSYGKFSLWFFFWLPSLKTRRWRNVYSGPIIYCFVLRPTSPHACALILVRVKVRVSVGVSVYVRIRISVQYCVVRTHTIYIYIYNIHIYVHVYIYAHTYIYALSHKQSGPPEARLRRVPKARATAGRAQSQVERAIGGLHGRPDGGVQPLIRQRLGMQGWVVESLCPSRLSFTCVLCENLPSQVILYTV